MSFRFQPLSVARRSSTVSNYLKNTLERSQLEYQTLNREGLMHPTGAIALRQDEGGFGNEVLLQRGIEASIP